jgi:hypothetical protein
MVMSLADYLRQSHSDEVSEKQASVSDTAYHNETQSQVPGHIQKEQDPIKQAFMEADALLPEETKQQVDALMYAQAQNIKKEASIKARTNTTNSVEPEEVIQDFDSQHYKQASMVVEELYNSYKLDNMIKIASDWETQMHHINTGQ